MKKRITIVAISLIPLLTVTLFILLGDDCLSETEAQSIYERAVKLESEKSYKEAYILFKRIDGYACSNYTLRGMAFNKALGIKSL